MSLQLHATVKFKNKTTKDVTASATLVPADAGVANVGNLAGHQGLASGTSVGVTTIKSQIPRTNRRGLEPGRPFSFQDNGAG